MHAKYEVYTMSDCDTKKYVSEFEKYLGHLCTVELEIKDQGHHKEHHLYLLPRFYYYRLGMKVNFTLPFTTSEMVSISTSETSNVPSSSSYGVLSLRLYDTPGLAPHIFFFWRPGDFPVSYSNRDTWWNAWIRHSGSFMVETGMLFSNMKSPSQEY